MQIHCALQLNTIVSFFVRMSNGADEYYNFSEKIFKKIPKLLYFVSKMWIKHVRCIEMSTNKPMLPQMVLKMTYRRHSLHIAICSSDVALPKNSSYASKYDR